MQKINFTNTTITQKPYVTINNVNYEVQDGVYTGGTDLNAQTFNDMQSNIETAINEISNSVGNIENLTTTNKDNIVGAINELQDKDKWKLIKAGITVSSSVGLGNINYRELYVEVSVGQTSVDTNENNITFIIPQKTLSTTEKSFRNGYYFTNEVNASVRLKITTTSILFNDAYYNGNQVNANSRMTVYYR